jgi:hypothetical protein
MHDTRRSRGNFQASLTYRRGPGLALLATFDVEEGGRSYFMKAGIVCVAVVALVGGQGCFSFDDDGDWDDSGWDRAPASTTPPGSPWGDPYYDSEYRTLDIQSAQLSGSMGEIRGFDELAYETTGSSGYGTTSVQVTIEHRGRYAMTALSVSGDLPAVEEGTTIDVVGYATTDTNITSISAIACGGSAPGVWDMFDVPATVQTVRVTDGSSPNLKRFEFDMDVYNLTNANTTYAIRNGTGLTNVRQNGDAASPITQIATFLSPTGVLGPRIIRFNVTYWFR